MKLKFYPTKYFHKMRIEYFDDLQNKIDYLSNIRSTLKIGDCKYEYHLRKLTIKIHYLQVEQDKLLNLLFI